MKKTTALMVLVLLLASLALTSCSSGLSDEEAKAIAAELIEKSYEVNRIFFGEGLPHEEDASPEDNTDYDVKPVNYLPVKSVEYHSTDDLKALAEQVYTDSFLEPVFKSAFDGITDSDGRIYQYARYLDSFYYGLSIRSDAEEDAISSGRVFDTSTIKIVGQGRNYVFFSVMSTVEVEEPTEETLSLKDEGSGWRLDSPTY